jgi:hypothetical protein
VAATFFVEPDEEEVSGRGSAVEEGAGGGVVEDGGGVARKEMRRRQPILDRGSSTRPEGAKRKMARRTYLRTYGLIAILLIEIDRDTCCL